MVLVNNPSTLETLNMSLFTKNTPNNFIPNTTLGRLVKGQPFKLPCGQDGEVRSSEPRNGLVWVKWDHSGMCAWWSADTEVVIGIY